MRKRKVAVKVCGVTDLAEALALEDLGVDYLGFIVGCKMSKRFLNFEEAKDIVKRLKVVRTVAVVCDLGFDDLVRMVTEGGFDVVQLHGRESFEYLAAVKHYFEERVEVWKAHVVGEGEDFERFNAVADKMLLDSGRGSGKLLETDLRAEVLAGGLKVENVLAQVLRFDPQVVDLNSGVEICPGRKDLIKVAKVIEILGNL